MGKTALYFYGKIHNNYEKSLDNYGKLHYNKRVSWVVADLQIQTSLESNGERYYHYQVAVAFLVLTIMKVTKRLINIASQIARNAERQRELNARLNNELEKMGVDLDDDRLAEVMAYLEGDCTTQPLIEYLEYDL